MLVASNMSLLVLLGQFCLDRGKTLCLKFSTRKIIFFSNVNLGCFLKNVLKISQILASILIKYI